jgi:hypothetical protein
LGIWEFGSLGIWEFGNLGIWEFGNLRIWEFGNFGIWEFGNLGFSVFERNLSLRIFFKEVPLGRFRKALSSRIFLKGIWEFGMCPPPPSLYLFLLPPLRDME